MPASAHKRRWSSEGGDTSGQSDDSDAMWTPRRRTHCSKRTRHSQPVRELTQAVVQEQSSSVCTSDEASTATAPEVKLRKRPLNSHSVQCSHAHSRTDSHHSKPAERIDHRPLPPVRCSHDVAGDTGSKTVNDPEEVCPNRDSCTVSTSKEAEKTVRIALKGYYERGEVTDREYRRILQRAIKKVSFMRHRKLNE